MAKKKPFKQKYKNYGLLLVKCFSATSILLFESIFILMLFFKLSLFIFDELGAIGYVVFCFVCVTVLILSLAFYMKLTDIFDEKHKVNKENEKV